MAINMLAAVLDRDSVTQSFMRPGVWRTCAAPPARPVFHVAPVKKNESFALAQFSDEHRAKLVSAGWMKSAEKVADYRVSGSLRGNIAENCRVSIAGL